MARESTPSRRPFHLAIERRAGDPESLPPEFRGKGCGLEESGHRPSSHVSASIVGRRGRLPWTWIAAKEFWLRREALPFARKTGQRLWLALELWEEESKGA